MELKNTKLEVCKKCWGTGNVHGGDENSTWSKTCADCHGIGFIRVPMTNADRIRAMSDEELAAFMFSMVDCVSCQNKLMNNGKLVFGADRKTCTDKDYYAMCDGDGRKCESVCLEWLKQPVE